MEENLANYLMDNFKFTRINKTHVFLGKERISRSKFIDDHIKIKVLQDAECIEVADYPKAEKDRFFKRVLDAIGQQLIDDFYDSRAAVDVPNLDLNRAQLVPLLDIKTDNIILYNNQIKNISEISYKAWERKMSKDDKGYIASLMRDALFAYDPYNLESFVPVEFESMEVLKVNTYSPPKWRLRPDPGHFDAECPEIIDRVLNHVFPDPKCRRFVLNWAWQALMTRNETYLVLNGPKGLGKGVFCELMVALVDKRHYSKAPMAFLTGQFNAVLDKKRLILIDEFKVGKDEHTRLKGYINKSQNIEKKGIDADKAVETFNSYIITNNDVTDMFIECDDRRFSVVDINSSRLDHVIDRKEITELIARLEDEDDDLIYQFGYYIYHYGKARGLDEFSYYQGKRFWELCYSSLYEWKRFIVDKILSREAKEYEIADLDREFQKDNLHSPIKFPRNYKRIGEFLVNYWHEGQDPLGVVDEEYNTKLIRVNEKYWPKDNDDQLELEDIL